MSKLLRELSVGYWVLSLTKSQSDSKGNKFKNDSHKPVKLVNNSYNYLPVGKQRKQKKRVAEIIVFGIDITMLLCPVNSMRASCVELEENEQILTFQDS